MKRTNKAFTLIEILVVLAIIGLIVSYAIVSMINSKLRAEDSRRVQDVSSIKTALELYMVENSRYPASLQDLTAGQKPLISDIPQDPSRDASRNYKYATSQDRTTYVLKAELSTKHEALNYDSDISVFGVSCDKSDNVLFGPYDYCIRP